MKVINHREFAMTDYNQFDGEMELFRLGDIVTKVTPDGTEIGVIIQIHDMTELRTDMFGNASISELSLSTLNEIKKHRIKLLPSISKNKFTIDYDKKILTIFFENEVFVLNLNDGDVGDFWNTLTNKKTNWWTSGIVKDVNFHQEDKQQEPTVCLYGVKDGEIDTSDEIVISEHICIGNPDNYFGVDIVAECGSEIEKSIEVEIITILEGGLIESHTLLSGVKRVEVVVKIIREQMTKWGYELPLDISNDDMENECYELLDGTGKEIKWEGSALTECP